MGSTPKYGLPWPEQVEGNDVSEHLEELAAATEAALQQTTRVVAQTFTASGTWTKPAGALWVEVLAWGGGGKGGFAASGTDGGGGGGGEFATMRISASLLPATVSATVGSGATTTGDSSADVFGGTTTFGEFLRARGGRSARYGAGQGNITTNVGVGGGVPAEADTAGGNGYGSSSVNGGGGGGPVQGTSNTSPGGGTGANSSGGGAAGTFASPNGSAGASFTAGPRGGGGGGGGYPQTPNGGNGGPGGTPGGGGGAASSGQDNVVKTGGNGARGEIRVYALCAGKA